MTQTNNDEAFKNATNELVDALSDMIHMHNLMMRQTNFGASFYDANCFKAMNEAPIKANQALANYEKFSEVEFVMVQGINHNPKIDYFRHWWDGLPENVREYFNQSDSMSAFDAGMHFNVNKLNASQNTSLTSETNTEVGE